MKAADAENTLHVRIVHTGIDQAINEVVEQNSRGNAVHVQSKQSRSTQCMETAQVNGADNTEIKSPNRSSTPARQADKNGGSSRQTPSPLTIGGTIGASQSAIARPQPRPVTLGVSSYTKLSTSRSTPELSLQQRCSEEMPWSKVRSLDRPSPTSISPSKGELSPTKEETQRSALKLTQDKLQVLSQTPTNASSRSPLVVSRATRKKPPAEASSSASPAVDARPSPQLPITMTVLQNQDQPRAPPVQSPSNATAFDRPMPPASPKATRLPETQKKHKSRSSSNLRSLSSSSATHKEKSTVKRQTHSLSDLSTVFSRSTKVPPRPDIAQRELDIYALGSDTPLYGQLVALWRNDILVNTQVCVAKKITPFGYSKLLCCWWQELFFFVFFYKMKKWMLC